MRVSLVFVILLLLSACGPRDAHYGPKALHLSGDVWPPEIVASDSRSTGVFPISTRQDSTVICCWLGRRSHFEVRKTSAARALKITVYIPKAEPFLTRQQAVTVHFPSYHRSVRVRALGTGFQTFDVAIPREMRRASGAQPIALDFAMGYQPLGPGGPTYGALLTSIYFD